MKRTLLFAAMLLLAALCVACGPATPYEQYQQAYQKLQKADSFNVTMYRHTKVNSETLANGVERRVDIVEGDARFARTEASEQAIMYVKRTEEGTQPAEVYSITYYRDGYQYVQQDGAPRFSCRREEGYTFWMLTQVLLDFPTQDVLSSEVKQSNEGGVVLSFELPAEKYHPYAKPETAQLFVIDDDSYTCEPLLFKVELDEDGRIISASSNLRIIKSASGEAIVLEVKACEFSDYNQVELDFSGFNKDDYPDLTAHVNPDILEQTE